MDTSLIGQKSTPKSIVVEQGQLQLFAKATGTKDKIYWDVEAAKAAGHRTLPAPPTFLMCLDSLAPSKDPGVLTQLGVDIGRILHGEQRFKYGKAIYAGDEITFQSEITDMYEKKGGALQFVVSESTATNQNGEVVGTVINSLVIR
ncbi:MAG: MaoC family dehydratase N-terminal domain-containing protein [Pseudomonadales bacterium]|nr:MaoC family dehydratase N-terminal domain-containing protein [Pseudomonadales bacterium]